MELIRENLTRQSRLIPWEKAAELRVSIVGCGAVGSWTGLLLAKMGVDRLTIYDHDTVDVVNMSSQVFAFSDIGENKAEALRRVITSHAPHAKVSAYSRKFDFTHDLEKPCDVMISCADSMAVRRELFEKTQAAWFIDGRMAAEKYHLYCVNTKDQAQRDNYSRTLYSDESAEQEPCTAKATGYCATNLASLIVREVKRIICEQQGLALQLGDFTIDEYYRE